MDGELKEYVMPDGHTYQFRECDKPQEAVLAKQEGKPETKKKAKPNDKKDD